MYRLRVRHTSCGSIYYCVAFAFYYYAVTYIIIINVIWTEGVSEIKYWIELNCQSALVDIFHPQCAIPILLASYCHLFFPVHYMIVHSKAVVHCSRWGRWQSKWFTWDVPLEILSQNRLYRKTSSPSSFAPPYNDANAISPATMMSSFACPIWLNTLACWHNWKSQLILFTAKPFPSPNRREVTSQPRIAWMKSMWSHTHGPSNCLACLMHHILFCCADFLGSDFRNTSCASISAWCSRRTSKYVSSPISTVSLCLADATAVSTMRTSASSFAWSILHPALSRLSLTGIVYESLIVNFVIQKFILLRFDHHSTGEVHCHPFIISRSSQVCGVFGCRIIVISIEDNGSSTVFLSHIPDIQVAPTLIGGASWPLYSME